MKIKYFLLLLSVSLLGLESCVVYRPHNVDIPLLEEPGDMHLDVSASMAAPLLTAPSLNASFAWAPLPLLGTQLYTSFSDLKNYHFQLAAGTYQSFNGTVLECYVGYGRGNSYEASNGTNHHYVISGFYDLVFSKINLGWNNIFDSSVDWGMGLKGGLLTPDWRKTEVFEDGTETLADEHDSPHFLFEPQLMLRLGGDMVKVSFNVAYAILTDWPTENNFFNYDRFSGSIGIHFKF